MIISFVDLEPWRQSLTVDGEAVDNCASCTTRSSSAVAKVLETYKCESPIGTPTGAGASPTAPVSCSRATHARGPRPRCTITRYCTPLPNRGYQYSVRAYNAYKPSYTNANPDIDGFSPWSDWITFYTASDRPRAVPIAAGLGARRGSSRLWSVPTLADLGQIPAISRYADKFGVVRPAAIEEIDILGFSLGETFVYNVSGLMPATNYSFSLAAANTEGTGSYSEYLFAMSASSAPEPPSGVTVHTFTDTVLNFKWTPAKSNGDAVTANTFELCRLNGKANSTVDTCATGPDSPTLLGPGNLILEQGQSTYAANSLVLPGRWYTFRVAAAQLAGSSPYSRPSAPRRPTCPVRPTPSA